MENILTIGGSDSLAGGGIEADLKTFEELDVFGVSVITSIVAITNTDALINQIDPPVVEQQLDSVFKMMPIKYIKTGLLGNLTSLKIVTAELKKLSDARIVIDPVLVFKEGQTTIKKSYLNYLRTELLPLGYVITPNLVEAAQLSGLPTITDREGMQEAAIRIQQFGCRNVVIKGGNRLAGSSAVDYLKLGDDEYWLTNSKVDCQTTDGAGCTFSAAITALLANRISLLDSVSFAKKFVHAGIEHGIVINDHLGNVWQGAYRKQRM